MCIRDLIQVHVKDMRCAGMLLISCKIQVSFRFEFVPLLQIRARWQAAVHPTKCIDS